MPYLGAHMSVAGGLHLAFERIEQVDGEALQIFSRNQRQWKPAPVTKEEAQLFAEAWKRSPGMQVSSHASYLINLATAKADLAKKSIDAFAGELDRCAILDIPYVVMHPGSHGGDGVDSGLARFTENLDKAMAKSDYTGMVLLETTAGQGTSLGADFTELGAIIQKSSFSPRLGVCFDTCHVFAAGYELRSQDGYNETMAQFDAAVGIEKLKFFHLNDSKKELGSRVDRHDHIGKGCIGIDGFANLLNDSRFSEHPMTLETPKEKDLKEDKANLHLLRSLL